MVATYLAAHNPLVVNHMVATCQAAHRVATYQATHMVATCQAVHMVIAFPSEHLPLEHLPSLERHPWVPHHNRLDMLQHEQVHLDQQVPEHSSSDSLSKPATKQFKPETPQPLIKAFGLTHFELPLMLRAIATRLTIIMPPFAATKVAAAITSSIATSMQLVAKLVKLLEPANHSIM